jgi:DNA-binding NarL/FixJ family response regulator
LPDIDGLHLLQHFSQAQLPVVVITGLHNPQLITQALQQGAQAFLLKDELSRTILEQTIGDAMEDMPLLAQAVAVPRPRRSAPQTP